MVCYAPQEAYLFFYVCLVGCVIGLEEVLLVVLLLWCGATTQQQNNKQKFIKSYGLCGGQRT